ncbi:sensor histidine kinase [Adhaeribacter pallidiroseus]|uniref:histidine kinase n=1 Tax=Adhaeribacter pallidiroseus TaxID=2072847 RepID=A0A369QI08_9BACT|nr:ATP-binding protein [Adhaeribacter pallidiroseus]RDC62866.1 Signal transduction histidine-protein kinase/phosphatase DegS [Adhaeribacter pallidiroseus]
MSDIPIIITTGTFIFLLTAGFITFFFYSYQQRLTAHLKEKEELKIIFQNEKLKAQLEMQEQTFHSISQEIHDNIGQILSLIRLNISTIKPDDYASTEQKISISKELLDQAIEDLRDLSKRLNTEFVNQQSLSALLQFQLSLIQKAGYHHTTLEVHGEEEANLDPEKKLIIFRIAQEALNNVIKHAAAQNIAVALVYLSDKIILSIKDDGRGLNPSKHSLITGWANGVGTYNMYYRAHLIGAEFSLQSHPGEGTLAHLILPLAS